MPTLQNNGQHDQRASGPTLGALSSTSEDSFSLADITVLLLGLAIATIEVACLIMLAIACVAYTLK